MQKGTPKFTRCYLDDRIVLKENPLRNLYLGKVNIHFSCRMSWIKLLCMLFKCLYKSIMESKRTIRPGSYPETVSQCSCIHVTADGEAELSLLAVLRKHIHTPRLTFEVDSMDPWITLHFTNRVGHFPLSTCGRLGARKPTAGEGEVQVSVCDVWRPGSQSSKKAISLMDSDLSPLMSKALKSFRALP